MTQIASSLVVATVFTWFIICTVCILQSEKGGLYARQNYLCGNLSVSMEKNEKISVSIDR